MRDFLDPYGFKMPEIVGVAATSPAFAPTDLSGLEFWFDGNDSSTFDLNVNKVIQWDDKSGNLNHLVQAVDARRPTYNAVTGRVTFVDVGNGQYLSNLAIAMTQPNTIYILFQDTLPAGAAGFIFDGITARQTMLRNANQWTISAGVGFVCAIASDGLDHIHTLLFNGAASSQTLDSGVPVVGNAGAVNLTDFVVGTRDNFTNGWDGEVMEIIGYDKEMPAAEHTQIINYLTTKWGL